MLIAIPISNKKFISKLSQSFGRSDFFLFYETETHTKRILYNPYKGTVGGAGIQSAQLMIEKKVNVVITYQIGLNALKILSSADIKTFLCTSGNCETAISLFLDNKLEPCTCNVFNQNRIQRTRFRKGRQN